MSSLFRSRCRPSGCAPLFTKEVAAQWRRGAVAPLASRGFAALALPQICRLLGEFDKLNCV